MNNAAGSWREELQNTRRRYTEAKQAYLDASAHLTRTIGRTYRSGVTQTDIAAEIGIARQSVIKRLNKLRASTGRR